MVRPASALPSPSLGQLCSLRALASAPPSQYLVSSYFVWPATSSLSSDQSHRLRALATSAVSDPFPASLPRTLTSSGLRPRTSSAVSKPVPAPTPSPSAFQPRCLRLLVSSAVSKSRPASPSPRPGEDPPSPGPEPAPPSPSPGPAPPVPSTFQLRRLLSLARFAVSDPPKSSGPWASSRFRAPGQLHRFRIFRYESTYIRYYSDRVHPLELDRACPPTLKVGGGAAAQLPCSYATGAVSSCSLAHDWNSIYRRVLPPRIG